MKVTSLLTVASAATAYAESSKAAPSETAKPSPSAVAEVKGDGAFIDAKVSITQGNYFSPTIYINGSSIVNIYNKQVVKNNIMTQATIKKFVSNNINYLDTPSQAPVWFYKPCKDCHVVAVDKGSNTYYAPPPSCPSCPAGNYTAPMRPPPAAEKPYGMMPCPDNTTVVTPPTVSGAPVPSPIPVPPVSVPGEYHVPPQPGQSSAPYYNVSYPAGSSAPGEYRVPPQPGQSVAPYYNVTSPAGSSAPGVVGVAQVPGSPSVAPEVSAPAPYVPGVSGSFGGSPAGSAAAAVAQAIASVVPQGVVPAPSAGAAYYPNVTYAPASPATAVQPLAAAVTVPGAPATPEQSAAFAAAQSAAAAQASSAYASLVAAQASQAAAAATLPAGAIVTPNASAPGVSAPGESVPGVVVPGASAPAGNTPVSPVSPGSTHSGLPAQSNTATTTQASFGAVLVIAVMAFFL